VQLRGGAGPLEERLGLYASSSLQRQLRGDFIRLTSKSHLPELTIALPHWQHERADVIGFDRLFDKLANDGDFRLVLWTRDWLDGAQPALELLNRYQRLLPLPRDYRPLPRLAELLNARRQLTSCRDGNDAWRWLLRMSARPTRSLELAALFHDLLLGAQDSNVSAVRGSLARLGFPRDEVGEATELASRSEPGEGAGPHLTLLRDARDLSFFSSQSWQFSREHGATATLAHVRKLLGRMTTRAVCLALATRQPSDVSSMIEAVLDEDDARRA
jgi:hypothetical protein